MDYQYHLEKYHGRSSRHECPKCHDPHSFTYYVDDNGNVLDRSVGRCNHESDCGYHYTPKEYFKDHPQNSIIGKMPNRMIQHSNRMLSVESSKSLEPGFIDKTFVVESYKSSLYDYLSNLGIFTKEQIRNSWHLYCIGATKNHSVIYWQIDKNQNIRTGKVIQYNINTGHRDKSLGANWVHAIMKKKGMLPTSFNLVQCLFGERLLIDFPTKKVGLVEAEKTALICSMVYPEYNWLATGGKSQMSAEKLSVLKGKEVIAFPDSDGYEVWAQKCKELRKYGIVINVSDYLQKVATEEQKKAKVDIADLLLDELIREKENREKKEREETNVKGETDTKEESNNSAFQKLNKELEDVGERDFIHDYVHYKINGYDVDCIDYLCPLQVFGKIARKNNLQPMTKEQWISSYQKIGRSDEKGKAPKYFEEYKNYFVKQGDKYIFNGKENH